MATEAEKFHAKDQRHGIAPKARKRAAAKKTRAEKLGAPHANERAGAKASYAAEAPPKTGRPSRKSSRKGANRSKPDTNLNLREERQKSSPEARFRKDSARAVRVRGSARRRGSVSPA